MVNILAALSALAYGCADFAGGLAGRRSSVPAVLAVSQSAGLLLALLVIPFIGGSLPSPSAWITGAAAGLAGAVGVGLLYHGLATGLAAVVSPAAALTGAAVPVVFGVLFGERPSMMVWAGVLLAFPAILLLASEKGDSDGKSAKSLGLGLTAGVAFGLFFILLSRTGEGTGLWPLVAARTASIPMIVLATTLMRFRKRRTAVKLHLKDLPATVLAGILDMAANILYLLAARAGLLIIAVVVTALYPAPTVILHRVFLGETMGARRWIGFILALTGMVMISLS